MEKVIGVVTSGKATLSKGRHDDDFADRLSSRYTPLILIIFTIVVTIQQIVRNPITCWAPVHFTDAHTKYANSYCWVRSTYYLPYEEYVPSHGEDKQMVKYYQWIQFIFLTQAVFFFLPTLVWRTFNSKAGVDADSILQTAHTIPDIKKADKREDTVAYLAGQIDRFLQSRKPDQGCTCDLKHFLSGFLCRCCGRRIGNFLVLLYVFQKILFIVNIICQFVALNALLGNKYYLYGAQVFMEPIPNHDWTSAQFVAFPRVTMCDVMVRRLGNNHRYTLQCVLPLNLYIEKMYVFLWFWMVFVLILSFLTTLMWLIRFMCRKDRLNFIRNHLYKAHQLETEDDNQWVHNFLDDYLRQDGAFLLRLVAGNTNHVSTSDIIKGVWQFWLRKTGREVLDDTTEPLNEDDDDLRPFPDTLPNNTGLKHRNPTPIDDGEEKPKEKPKTNLHRTPTTYIRGSDTLGSKRPESGLYPSVRFHDKNEKPSDEKPESEDSGTAYEDTPPGSKPSAPPSDEVTPPLSSDESDPDIKIQPDKKDPVSKDAPRRKSPPPKGQESPNLSDISGDADMTGNLGSLYPNLSAPPVPAPRRPTTDGADDGSIPSAPIAGHEMETDL